MKLLKEVYLSLFVVSYRFAAGLWPAYMDMDSTKGVAFVTAIGGFFAIAVLGWIEIMVGRSLNADRWMVWLAAVMLYGANLYVLVIKGIGVAFERQFDQFEKRKRVALRLAAIAVILATGVFFGFSVQYHRAWVFQRQANIPSVWPPVSAKPLNSFTIPR